MPPKLVRITFNHENTKSFIVEYGTCLELSPEDQDERDLLQQDLLEFKDFISAQELGDTQRQELMDKKRRLEILNKINEGNEILWEPAEFVYSILLMLRPDYMPIYVENLPNELFDKLLLESHFTLNVTPTEITRIPAITPQSTPQPNLEEPKLERVKTVITSIKEIPMMSANKDQPWLAEKHGDNYNGLIYVSRESPLPGEQQSSLMNGIIYVWPVKYLKDDWKPINKALKKAFSDKVEWLRTDPGKFSHWIVKP